MNRQFAAGEVIIVDDRQVLDVLEEVGSIPCAIVYLGLTAYRGQRGSPCLYRHI
jgi:hypothetical protein